MFPKVVCYPEYRRPSAKIFAYARQKKAFQSPSVLQAPAQWPIEGNGISLTLVGTGLAQPLKMVVNGLGCALALYCSARNLALQPYGYRLGPDRQVQAVATIGASSRTTPAECVRNGGRILTRRSDPFPFFCRLEPTSTPPPRMPRISLRFKSHHCGGSSSISEKSNKIRVGRTTHEEIQHQEHDWLSHGCVPPMKLRSEHLP